MNDNGHYATASRADNKVIGVKRTLLRGHSSKGEERTARGNSSGRQQCRRECREEKHLSVHDFPPYSLPDFHGFSHSR